MGYKHLVIIVLVVLNFAIRSDVAAQANSTPVECGTILEAEFTTASGDQDYSIALHPGDTLSVEVIPIGNTLNGQVHIYDPANDHVGYTPFYSNGNVVVSATGVYTIKLGTNDIGAYTIYIGCTLRDGTVIAPGDVSPTTAENPISDVPAAAPAFSGFGFPGLAPVDFSIATTAPLLEGTPLSGVISPTNSEILGFVFSADAENTLDLNFTRLSGNLNLGIIVLSANNEVVFQVSLVTSNTFSTQLTLPSAQEYTVGVFRVDLLPPAAPEATMFQVQIDIQ